MKNGASTPLKKLIPKDIYFTRLLILFALSFMVLAIFRPDRFLSFPIFQSMSFQFPQFGLMALGIALTMIAGGIDLSTVGVANLSAIVAAKVLINLTYYTNATGTVGTMAVAIAAALLVGIVAGIINGVLISVVGIPPILATLGSMQMFRGIAIVLTGGSTVSGLPTLWSDAINTTMFNLIPLPLLIFVMMAVLVYILLNKMSYGKKLYMVGTNTKAATFSGLKVKLIQVQTYAISGILAATAGLVMMGRMNSARADAGLQYTLQCILVVVLAGVNPKGGSGKVGSVVLSILLLQLLSTGLNLFPAINNFYRSLIWGGVLLLALAINHLVYLKPQRVGISKS